MSTSAVTDEENRFGRGVAVLRCSAEERERLRRLLDEFHPAVDVFSLRERPPDVVELEIQFDVGAGPDPASLLRHRLPGLEG